MAAAMIGAVQTDPTWRAAVFRAELAAEVRAEDTLGRWGGEEFLALLPNTDERASIQVAERIRKAACRDPIELVDEHTLQVTVSIGCATSVGPLADLLSRADKALYYAKSSGRDRVALNEQVAANDLS